MAKKSGKKYSYKEGFSKLEEIVAKYRKAYIFTSLLERKVYVLNEKEDEDKIRELNNYRLLFEAFLSTLHEEEKLVIKNDFYDRVNENWWIGIYSRSTYYRIKNRAIEKMLFYYE